MRQIFEDACCKGKEASNFKFIIDSFFFLNFYMVTFLRRKASPSRDVKIFLEQDECKYLKSRGFEL